MPLLIRHGVAGELGLLVIRHTESVPVSGLSLSSDPQVSRARNTHERLDVILPGLVEEGSRLTLTSSPVVVVLLGVIGLPLLRKEENRPVTHQVSVLNPHLGNETLGVGHVHDPLVIASGLELSNEEVLVPVDERRKHNPIRLLELGKILHTKLVDVNGTLVNLDKSDHFVLLLMRRGMSYSSRR